MTPTSPLIRACAAGAPSSRPASPFQWPVTAVALTLALSVVVWPARAQDTTPTPMRPAPAAIPPSGLVTGLPDFTGLVEHVGPAVVNIRTTERINPRQLPQGPGIEELLRRFGIPIPNVPNAPGQTPDVPGDDDLPERRGVGSGFILSADGYVMTNAHVVEGADELLVTLPDKREFKARVVGADTRTDVAVVKIEATGLPYVAIGDVNALKVGQWVVAIGSPFNLPNTVTAGIVSAKQRDTGEFIPFIQTDVAINPGNSGGPLINMRGEVVGINSQIYSPSGGYAGISFAIPIDEAMRVADQLRTHGRVIRGRIGVRIAPVTKDVAESIGLGKPMGALVQGVDGGAPADAAGVEAGDIITKVDERSVENFTDLSRMIAAIQPGKRITLQVFRRGKYVELPLTVAEMQPDGDGAAAPVPAAPPSSAAASNLLGLVVRELSADQRRELKLKGGVVVEQADGPAAQAGLRQGDILLRIDNSEVADIPQFNKAVASARKGSPVAVLVRRGDVVDYVVLRP